jgi:hypothetical protein
MKKICKINYLRSLVLLFFFGMSDPGLESQTNIDDTSEEQAVIAIRDAKEVMQAHAAEFMAIPGVVGVYTGVLDDGTSCITVMVKKRTPELEQKIPQSLEGVPVVTEETGEIRPISDAPD